MNESQHQIDTCHDHPRDALHQGEEDNDGAVGVDVARTIPETFHPCLNNDVDGELIPDGGHGLDAEEQGRGEVVDPGDTLEKRQIGRGRDQLFTFLASNSSSAESHFEVFLSKLLGQPSQVFSDTCKSRSSREVFYANSSHGPRKWPHSRPRRSSR